MSCLIDYDDYFLGKASFDVYPNNNLILEYGFKSNYQFKIYEFKQKFYSFSIEKNSFYFLGTIDYFFGKINLPFNNSNVINKKEFLILEKILHHSKEEDFVLLKNNFVIHPLNCFYCGKKLINPNNILGPDCEMRHGRTIRQYI